MKSAYRNLNEKIRPDDSLKDRVFEKLERKPVHRFRPAAAVAAVLAVILLATPVMAAQIPVVSDWLYALSPEIAERFTPIRKSDVKNGIKMEVASASIHGSTAEVIVTFEDLEGDRISYNYLPEFEVRDYTKNDSLISGMTAKKLDYDYETGISTFLFELTYLNATVEEVMGNKFTLIAYGGENYLPDEEYDVPLTLTDSETMTVKPETMTAMVERGYLTDHAGKFQFDGFGKGAQEGYEAWNSREEYTVIVPGVPVCEVTEGFDIMGMTYIDGQLHIQYRLRDELDGCLWLEDQAGNKIYWQCLNYINIFEGENYGYYNEDIFDISEEEVGSYRVHCSVRPVEQIEGPWKVTFEFTESDYVDEGKPAQTTEPVSN